MITEIVSTVVAAPLKMIVVSLQVTGEARPIALRLTGSSGEPLTPGTAHGETGGETLAGGRTGESGEEGGSWNSMGEGRAGGRK